MPLFIGAVVDLLSKEDFEAVGTLCLYMLMIIVVSYTSINLSQVSSLALCQVLWLMHRNESRYLQHSQ